MSEEKANEKANEETQTRFVIYDMGTEHLITTYLFPSYESAVEHADMLDDVLILPLRIVTMHVRGRAAEGR